MRIFNLSPREKVLLFPGAFLLKNVALQDEINYTKEKADRWLSY